jgi:hypothetical protein
VEVVLVEADSLVVEVAAEVVVAGSHTLTIYNLIFTYQMQLKNRLCKLARRR